MAKKKSEQTDMLVLGTKFSLVAMFFALAFVPRTEFLFGYTMHTCVFFAAAFVMLFCLCMRVAQFVSRRNASRSSTDSAAA